MNNNKSTTTPSLTGLLPDEISALLPNSSPSYRGTQIFRWIHEHGARSFDEMTNLSKQFREEIKGQFSIGELYLTERQSSNDLSTDKFLWTLRDGNRIESVVIRDQGRVTACISSQVGCKMNCGFCRTGGMGFIRNLTSGEIIDQPIMMNRFLAETGEEITNIVFMGMGEPLDNFDAVSKTISIINMETALEISQRKVTVSTCGIPPYIINLADSFRKVGLAISLNAADDRLRSKLMPVNKKYPLKDLLDAARYFAKKTRRRITFEYILIDGVNDSPADAHKLLKIAGSVPSKINLITYNEFPGSPFRKPSVERALAFQRILFEGNITAMIRKSKGSDILAACGQLAVKHSGEGSNDRADKPGNA